MKQKLTQQYFTPEYIEECARNAKTCFEDYFIKKLREDEYDEIDMECTSDFGDCSTSEHEICTFERIVKERKYTIDYSDNSFGRLVRFGGCVNYALDIACCINGIQCVVSLIDVSCYGRIPKPFEFSITVVMNTQFLGVYPPIVASV